MSRVPDHGQIAANDWRFHGRTFGLLASLILAPAMSHAQVIASLREVPAGGLIFVPDGAIAIESQEVQISRDQVRSIYQTRHSGSTSRSIVITFQLPEIDLASLGDQILVLPVGAPENFVGAKVTANGQPVQLQFQQRAIAFGLDVTDALGEVGITLFPYAAGMADMLRKLPEDTRKDFVERGIVRREDDRTDANWTLRTTAYWRQEFAPDSAMTLALNYVPITLNGPYSAATLQSVGKPYCADKAIAAKAATLGGGTSQLTGVGYALTAGSAAAAPIPSFRLLIEKPRAESLVATCNAQMRSIGPTALEWVATNFEAEEDLHVIFID